MQQWTHSICDDTQPPMVMKKMWQNSTKKSVLDHSLRWVVPCWWIWSAVCTVYCGCRPTSAFVAVVQCFSPEVGRLNRVFPRSTASLCLVRPDHSDRTSSDLAQISNSRRTQYQTEDDHDDSIDDDDTTSFHLSHAKWKRKRYLLMKDIKDCLSAGHANTALRKAEELIQRCWTVYRKSQNDPSFTPTTEVYNLWIHTIAKAESRPQQRRHQQQRPLAGAGERAEQILREMHQGGIVKPNVVTYTTVMDAYARESQYDKSAAASTEFVLWDLIRHAEIQRWQVTSITCDTVLKAWAQQRTWEGAERAEQILQRLEDMSESSSSGSTGSAIRPTVHSYATVMDGWAKCSNRSSDAAAVRAHKLLQHMLQKCHPSSSRTSRKTKTNNLHFVRPDTLVFNACLNAWAKHCTPQAAAKAEQLLQQMQELYQEGYDCQPDAITYNTVLSAYSHSGHEYAGLKAERILQQMRDAHRASPNTTPEPTTDSYNNVLNAWANTSPVLQKNENSPVNATKNTWVNQPDGPARRAETILNFMINSNSSNIAPDIYSFTSVLNAWAKSKHPDKAVHAQKLLERLLEQYTKTKNPRLRPSPIPFNVVLNAAAYSQEGTTSEQKRTAVQVAVQTVGWMKGQNIDPDETSYKALLQTFANLIPPGPSRIEMALTVFSQCCEEGKVSDIVWNEVRRAVPAKELLQMVEKQTGRKATRMTDVRSLPREWRRRTLSTPTKPSTTTVLPKRQREKSPHNDPQKVEQKVLDRRRAPIKRFRTISESSYQSNRDL